MAQWGLSPSDYPQPATLVWPDNWKAVSFFADLGSGAWNMGPGGAAGIRPEAFREIRLAHRIGRDEWPAIHQAVLLMQEAALVEIHRED